VNGRTQGLARRLPVACSCLPDANFPWPEIGARVAWKRHENACSEDPLAQHESPVDLVASVHCHWSSTVRDATKRTVNTVPSVKTW
jgi:hypothetical protein